VKEEQRIMIIYLSTNSLLELNPEKSKEGGKK